MELRRDLINTYFQQFGNYAKYLEPPPLIKLPGLFCQSTTAWNRLNVHRCLRWHLPTQLSGCSIMWHVMLINYRIYFVQSPRSFGEESSKWWLGDGKGKQTQLYTTTWYPLGDGSFCDGFPGQFVISQLCTSYFPYCYDNIISYQQLQGCFILGSRFAGIINPCVGSQSIGACAICSQEEEREEGRCSACFAFWFSPGSRPMDGAAHT